MSTAKGHPSRDELLAMAYADGELDPAARAELDLRIAREPELARTIVQYQRLEIVARHVAPAEPADHEWRRLAEDGLQRAGAGLGWALAFVGGLVLAGYAAYEIYDSELSAVAKAAVCTFLFGLVLLFLTTLRARLRTLPYDPYTEVER